MGGKERREGRADLDAVVGVLVAGLREADRAVVDQLQQLLPAPPPRESCTNDEFVCA